MQWQGAAAEFARERLETGHYEKAGRLQRINTNDHDPAQQVAGCSMIVTAVGFQRNALPDITVDGQPLADVRHDPQSGVIVSGSLYGYGIAFPEEIRDPQFGVKESNVGLLKFMKFVRKVLPAQQLCTL